MSDNLLISGEIFERLDPIKLTTLGNLLPDLGNVILILDLNNPPVLFFIFLVILFLVILFLVRPMIL